MRVEGEACAYPICVTSLVSPITIFRYRFCRFDTEELCQLLLQRMSEYHG